MRVSEQEQASQTRMSQVAAEVSRTVQRLVEESPELTRVEIAFALTEVTQRWLGHQRRVETPPIVCSLRG